MARTLQDLRQEAGYESARKFALEHDLTYATYCRWERSPEKIPMETAWELANTFNCSIDEVVGHETGHSSRIKAKPASSAYQQAIEALSEEGKQLVADAIELAQLRDRKNQHRKEEAETRYWERICQRYEAAMWVQQPLPATFNALPMGAGVALDRERFSEYLAELARTKREREIKEKYADLAKDLAVNGGTFEGKNPGEADYDQQMSELADEAINLELEKAEAADDETIGKIMAAYDRIHGSSQPYC